MKHLFISLFSVALLGSFGWVHAQQALTVGAKAPEFSATAVAGGKVSLKELRKTGPVVMVFYRGQWCPFCNAYVKALQDSVKLITDAGATLVAISPEKTENAKKIIEKSGATFPFLHDRNTEIMNAYGVTFQVDEATQGKLKGYGIDLAEANGENGTVLPVPAVYIIGKDGLVKWVHFNPDFKVRPAITTLVAQLQTLKN